MNIVEKHFRFARRTFDLIFDDFGQRFADLLQIRVHIDRWGRGDLQEMFIVVSTENEEKTSTNFFLFQKGQERINQSVIDFHGEFLNQQFKIFEMHHVRSARFRFVDAQFDERFLH